jgi:hypothetical protein
MSYASEVGAVVFLAILAVVLIIIWIGVIVYYRSQLAHSAYLRAPMIG